MTLITDMSADEARAFLLKAESYFSLDMPRYVDFSEILKNVSSYLENRSLSSVRNTSPREYGNVNYSITNSKDGKFAWRPFEIIHPVLYVNLVDTITNLKKWKHIKNTVKENLSSEKISCCSLPFESNDDGRSDTAAQVTSWWEKVEQDSLNFALQYQYVHHTDIINCYGSIYTHSIPWSLHGKENAKEHRTDKSLVGNNIDRSIQDMSYGQTNGIPQGSVLSDFIAEIVLSYADKRVSRRIESNTSIASDFHILRYRDDYRIFSNSERQGQLILKELSEELADLNFRLNGSKTEFSKYVIRSSIKDDKMDLITSFYHRNSSQKRLLAIYDFAESHPNSGSLIKLLTSFYNDLEDMNTYPYSSESFISIVTEIAYRNPRAYPQCAAIISYFVSNIKSTSKINRIISRILNKFNSIPNTGHLEVWLQRITIPSGISPSYSEPICRKVNSSAYELWDCRWLNQALVDGINEASIVDKEKMEGMKARISQSEVDLFKNKDYEA